MHPGSGRASLTVHDLELEDYGNINNALSDGPSVEATASYHVEWLGGHDHVQLNDPDQQLAATFVEGDARVEWGAQTADGFRFVSDPAATSTTVFAVAGKERNGSFFD